MAVKRPYPGDDCLQNATLLRGTWEVQSIGRPTLHFSSGHDLKILMHGAPCWALIISLIILPGQLSKEKIRLRLVSVIICLKINSLKLLRAGMQNVLCVFTQQQIIIKHLLCASQVLSAGNAVMSKTGSSCPHFAYRFKTQAHSKHINP